MKYKVIKLKGKQYLISSGEKIEVDKIDSSAKEIECEEILLDVEGKEVKIGKPVLKDKVVLNIEGEKKEKIRVATYKAKSNFRRVRGAKNVKTIISLA